jgi:hypothetical protein
MENSDQPTTPVLEPEIMDDSFIPKPRADYPVITFTESGRLPALHTNHRERMGSFAGRLADAMASVEENTEEMVKLAEMMAKEAKKRRDEFAKQLRESGM